MNKNRLLQIIGIILILVLGIVYWNSSRTLKQFPDNVRKAKQLHHQGEIGKSIPLLETLIAQASTKEEEAKLKLTLASDYSKINYRKGIALWKEVAENSSYLPQQRGFALQYIADMYMLGSRSVSVADAVFSGTSYSQLLDYKKGSPILEGIRALYERVFVLTVSDAPAFPINHYRVAEWYVNEVLNNSDTYPDPKNSEPYQMAKSHYELGTQALQSFLATNPEESQVLYVQWLQAMILGHLAALEQSSDKRDEADIKFTQALANADANHLHVKRQIQWARFYHALFLHQNYGKSRIADIMTNLDYLLLSEFFNSPFNEFLTKLTFSGNEYTWLKKDTAVLAAYYPAFAEFLKNIGWKL